MGEKKSVNSEVAASEFCFVSMDVSSYLSVVNNILLLCYSSSMNANTKPVVPPSEVCHVCSQLAQLHTTSQSHL